MHALITGGGSGIGKALTEHLISLKDAHVTIVGRRLKNLLAVKNISPDKIDVVEADVASIEGRNKIVSNIKNSERLTHIVHCAGVITPIVPLQNMQVQDYQQTLAINTEAPLFLTQALLPFIAKNSRVLFISSSAAEEPHHGLAAYGISKYAIEMVCQAFQLEFSKNPNIQFACVRPGGANTPLIEELKKSNVPIYSRHDSLRERLDSGYFHDPKFVASFIAWVLLGTSNEEYEKVWSMRNEEDRSRWMNSHT